VEVETVLGIGVVEVAGEVVSPFPLNFPNSSASSIGSSSSVPKSKDFLESIVVVAEVLVEVPTVEEVVLVAPVVENRPSVDASVDKGVLITGDEIKDPIVVECISVEEFEVTLFSD